MKQSFPTATPPSACSPFSNGLLGLLCGFVAIARNALGAPRGCTLYSKPIRIKDETGGIRTYRVSIERSN